ncbi:MAG: GHKL domain-containing protein [Ruminococcus sp.]|nr:GHKL domain-containing protein [Ruminococcus sp.]
MNGTVQSILAILGTVFDMFTTIMLYNTCLGKKNIKVNKILFYTIFVLGYAIGLMLSQFGYMPFLYIVKSVVLFFGFTMLYRSKWIIRIFTMLSNVLFGMISELISYGIIVSTLPNTPEQSQQNYSIMLSKLITFAFTVAVMLIIRKNTQIVKFKDYLCFIITPLISIATIITISFEFDTGEPNATIGICFAAAGLMIINIIVYYLLENIIDATEIREKQARMEQQFAFQEEKYEQASQSFRSISSVIHDTNKHLVYLNECVERHEFDEAKRYIGTAIEHIDKSYKRINTGFLPIDALVSNSLNIAEANNITFKSDIKIEKERICIERYDLCVALGNLLDNAVEACKKVSNPDDRIISVSIITGDNSMVIHIENSAERMKENDFKTDKKDKLLHGYGISNVKAISEKYGGVFTIERRESSCEATLIFPI